jgi:hypothetical protein
MQPAKFKGRWANSVAGYLQRNPVVTDHRSFLPDKNRDWKNAINKIDTYRTQVKISYSVTLE